MLSRTMGETIYTGAGSMEEAGALIDSSRVSRFLQSPPRRSKL